MWSSSCVGPPGTSSESSSLQSIAQYIEDYIDLVENVPNDLVRSVTQLHERNHRYHQLLDQLESVMYSSPETTPNGDHRKKSSLLTIQRCLVEIQEISDEKLFIVQSILEQLDGKARQLDYDYRNVTLASSISGNKPSYPDLSGQSKPGINDILTASNVVDQQSDSLGKESGNGGNNSGSPQSYSSITPGNKRSSARRSKSNNNSENGHDPPTSGKRMKKNQGNRGQGRRKNKEPLNQSPPIYDDPPIDPDEPTYCLCDQVSFGEMICCDNDNCEIEWFHFSCVTLNVKPKGKWFCPNCRGDRSNIPKK